MFEWNLVFAEIEITTTTTKNKALTFDILFMRKKDTHGYRTNIFNVLDIDTFEQNRCESILIGYNLYDKIDWKMMSFSMKWWCACESL